MCLYGASEVAKLRIEQVQSPKTVNTAKTIHQNQKTIAPLESSGIFTQFQKKFHLIWSPDDQVMASQSQGAKCKINLERGSTGELGC